MFRTMKRILLAVYRLEEGQQEILNRLNRLEQDKPSAEPEQRQTEWMQQGIDNILGYEWPPKRGDKG